MRSQRKTQTRLGHPGRAIRRQKEICVGSKQERPQTFVQAVLALLEERFPWLGSGHDQPVSGAVTVDELGDLYRSLIRERDKASREDPDPEV